MKKKMKKLIYVDRNKHKRTEADGFSSLNWHFSVAILMPRFSSDVDRLSFRSFLLLYRSSLHATSSTCEKARNVFRTTHAALKETLITRRYNVL